MGWKTAYFSSGALLYFQDLVAGMGGASSTKRLLYFQNRSSKEGGWRMEGGQGTCSVGRARRAGMAPLVLVDLREDIVVRPIACYLPVSPSRPLPTVLVQFRVLVVVI